MKKNNNIITETFEVGTENFCVDVVRDNNERTYNAWLYRKDVGVKAYMFAVSQDNESYDSFIEMVEANLITENYMELYDEDYNF